MASIKLSHSLASHATASPLHTQREHDAVADAVAKEAAAIKKAAAKESAVAKDLGNLQITSAEFHKLETVHADLSIVDEDKKSRCSKCGHNSVVRVTSDDWLATTNARRRDAQDALDKKQPPGGAIPLWPRARTFFLGDFRHPRMTPHVK
jgi:hypothetical protein